MGIKNVSGIRPVTSAEAAHLAEEAATHQSAAEALDPEAPTSLARKRVSP